MTVARQEWKVGITGAVVVVSEDGNVVGLTSILWFSSSSNVLTAVVGLVVL